MNEHNLSSLKKANRLSRKISQVIRSRASFNQSAIDKLFHEALENSDVRDSVQLSNMNSEKIQELEMKIVKLSEQCQFLTKQNRLLREAIKKGKSIINSLNEKLIRSKQAISSFRIQNQRLANDNLLLCGKRNSQIVCHDYQQKKYKQCCTQTQLWFSSENKIPRKMGYGRTIFISVPQNKNCSKNCSIKLEQLEEKVKSLYIASAGEIESHRCQIKKLIIIIKTLKQQKRKLDQSRQETEKQIHSLKSAEQQIKKELWKQNLKMLVHKIEAEWSDMNKRNN